jgi:hypothetical protein
MFSPFLVTITEIRKPDTFHPITEEASSGSDNSGPQETRKQQKTAIFALILWEEQRLNRF